MLSKLNIIQPKKYVQLCRQVDLFFLLSLLFGLFINSNSMEFFDLFFSVQPANPRDPKTDFIDRKRAKKLTKTASM